MSELPVQTWGLWEREEAPQVPAAPAPNAEWIFPAERTRQGGMARVYYAQGHDRLTNPVIISDGFNSGPSNMDEFWDGLENKGYAFATELSRRGYDLILLGYLERSASLLDNARVAQDCIHRAISERVGNAPLTVGGFSVGGIITRYTLAKMESENIDHETALYFSYDSPHRGAWIPVSLQALAHFMTGIPALSKQINSPASRQLLWRHISTVEEAPQEDELRAEFREALAKVGSWPMRPRKIGVANGNGRGVGNDVPPGVKALECTQGVFKPTTLMTQSPDNRIVLAHLKGLLQEKEVRVRGLPEADGAPGGMLESFGIAAANLTKPLLGMKAKAYYDSICFVPTVSAVDIRDISQETLYEDVSAISPQASDLDEFTCSSTNTMHSQMTAELGGWILDRLPER
ncbi:hypothetical protein ABCR94_24030 [Streptomyces sp. 21So2-11]|uniref:hypothetical protein n=1 Tax=Streptomyces sp. 21So2-11 TaxID=3144408 RepID=UPI003219D6C4